MNTADGDRLSHAEITEAESRLIYGKLLALEELVDYLNVLRESYTKTLEINGCDQMGNWKEKRMETFLDYINE
tara:strand:- start:177 stop:395 length:219 start_codon:yes stop_codon:yes gene_type:complete